MDVAISRSCFTSSPPPIVVASDFNKKSPIDCIPSCIREPSASNAATFLSPRDVLAV